MSRGVRWVIVGCAALLALAGCGRSWFAEREPWRREAEEQCLRSGAVKESPNVALVSPITGPGICGADFPLKVAALGDSRMLGYGDELRPPGSIPQGAIPRPTSSYPSTGYPRASPPPGYPADTPFAVNSAYPADTRLPPNSDDRFGPGGSAGRAPGYSPPPVAAPPRSGDPISLSPPGVAPAGRDTPGSYATPGPSYRAPRTAPSPRSTVESYPVDPARDDAPRSGYPPARDENPRYPPLYSAPPSAPNVPMSPSRGRMVTGSIGPAEVTPSATLACPIVSALDRWVTDAVQPAALRWFAQPVVELKQISAYSCRGMNGQPGARISEHAFGNALDIAAFRLADGHVVTVKNGWRGTPEEQGFLHDVQLAACEQFTTVLAPGSNAFHYDHIHVDLMRRASGRRICEPAAVAGEVVAARARARYAGANRGDPGITGSIGSSRGTAASRYMSYDREEARARGLPHAVPGED